MVRPKEVPIPEFDENKPLNMQEMVDAFVLLSGEYHLVVNQCNGLINYYEDVAPEKVSK